MKKFHTVSLVLGFVLLIVLIRSIGLTALWQDLARLGWGLVPIILIEGMADILHTQGWRNCLSAVHRDLSFFRLYRIRTAGSAINYLTPTAALGGEVTKGTLLSLNHGGPEAAAAVIIGKLAYAQTRLISAVIGSLVTLWRIPLPDAAWLALSSGTALLAAAFAAFLVVQKYGKFGVILRSLAARRLGGRLLGRAAEHIDLLDQALKTFYRENPRGLPMAMLWHGAGMACGILQSWYFLFLLTEKSSLLMAAGIWCIASWLDMLVFVVPLDIGVLEGTRVLVFRLLGFAPSLGLTFGVALRLEQLFWAGVGLLFYATLLPEIKKKAVRSAQRQAENPQPQSARPLDSDGGTGYMEQKG